MHGLGGGGARRESAGGAGTRAGAAVVDDRPRVARAVRDRPWRRAADQATVETLLRLAGHAAHSSERWAAPLACWLVGRRGVDPVTALDCAQDV